MPTENKPSKFIAFFERAEQFPSGNRFHIFLYPALLLICFLTYHNIFNNWLFNDDFLWLYHARYDMTPKNLVTFLVIDFFRPLINLSFYVIEQSLPGDVRVHYLLNFFVHYFNCILVYHLIRLLLQNKEIAAACAVLFAVTSVHQAAICWISARTSLLASFFLLASLLAMLSWLTVTGAAASSSPGSRGSPSDQSLGQARSTSRCGWQLIGFAVLLYMLALLAKETAIVGFPLALCLYIFGRTEGTNPRQGRIVLVSFGAVTIAYLIVRTVLLGTNFSDNWGPGAHMLRNLGGAFLFQLYPWPVFGLGLVPYRSLQELNHPYLPEALALPAAAIVLLLGYKTGRFRDFLLAIGWMCIAGVPASLFRYRFFTLSSMSQDRYYYLSSVGSVLITVLLLAIVWRLRSRVFKLLAIGGFLFLVAGYIKDVQHIEKKWENYTRFDRNVVQTFVQNIDNSIPAPRVVVQDPPMEFRYLEKAVALERPAWNLVPITGGQTLSDSLLPCLYVYYQTSPRLVMNIKRFE
jgi:hypothetical protein